MPGSSCPANLDASSTEVIGQNITSGFALTLIENGFATPKEFVNDSSENSMTNIKKLHEKYTMQGDDFLYTWDNKCQIDIYGEL